MDAQAGMEAMYSNIMAALSGTNLTHDNGYMGAGLIGSLEMILLCSEISQFIKRVQKGVEVSKETLCVDLIDKVGHGGDYISEAHTAMTFRKELFIPAFLNRRQYHAWLESGAEPIEKILNRRAREIIEADTPILLTPETIREYEAVIERRGRQICI